ncbi:MAG: glycosyltransferase family 4 protein, partial [Pseudomonadota bacterium]
MKIAFYAPMKPADHPTPSGDREIARLTHEALSRGPFEPVTASTLRTLDMAGSPEVQTNLFAAAGEEADWLVEAYSSSPPVLWFTYHCHYKAPDLVGPVVAAALQIPYVISEPSISPRRRTGGWAQFSAASDAAISHADLLFWTTPRDLPALQAAGHSGKLCHLPPFLEPGEAVGPSDCHEPIRLLTIAMMRPGAKLESYRRLAKALDHLDLRWELTVIGGGEEEATVNALLDGHLDKVSFIGTVTDPDVIQAHLGQADLFVWPGVEEGVGLVWLEAQAAGVPVVAEDGPAARHVISGGVLAPPDHPAAFCEAIRTALRQHADLAQRARRHVIEKHSLDAAAQRLGTELMALI